MDAESCLCTQDNMKEVEIKSVQRTVEYIGRNCNKEVKNHAVVRNHISHLPPTRLKRFKI